MTTKELAQALRSDKLVVLPPKAAQFGTGLAAFKLDGKTPTFQAASTKGPYVRTSRGIMSSIEDGDSGEAAAKKDNPRRSISFRAPEEGTDLRDCLDEIQRFAERTIKANYPKWKEPKMQRLPSIVKLMVANGLDPEQITDEEIESANTYKPQGFGMPVVVKGQPIKDKPNECYPATWKAKINVRPYNQLPAATFAHIYEVNGQRVIKDNMDYQLFEECGYDSIPIVQVVGIQFKNDQWRVLLTVTKLFKMGEGRANAEPVLRMDDGDVVPVPVDQVAVVADESASAPKQGVKRSAPSDSEDSHAHAAHKQKLDHPSTEEGEDPNFF